MNKEKEKALKNVPKGLPVYLNMLTTAGHLLAAGYKQVQESTGAEYGLPGTALIFAPVFIEPEEGQTDTYMDVMFEIRINALLSLQQAAEEANVTYRTIQRWRDEHKLPVLTDKDGKQVVPLEILRDVAKRR